MAAECRFTSRFETTFEVLEVLFVRSTIKNR